MLKGLTVTIPSEWFYSPSQKKYIRWNEFGCICFDRVVIAAQCTVTFLRSIEFPQI